MSCHTILYQSYYLTITGDESRLLGGGPRGRGGHPCNNKDLIIVILKKTTTTTTTTNNNNNIDR